MAGTGVAIASQNCLFVSRLQAFRDESLQPKQTPFTHCFRSDKTLRLRPWLGLQGIDKHGQVKQYRMKTA